MSRSGIPLFRRSRVLTRYIESLPVAAHQAIGQLLDQEHEVPEDEPDQERRAPEQQTQEELLTQLRQRFLLWPLTPAGLMWTMVDRARTSYRDAQGADRAGYLV